jgi:pilus assembly protein Flp/PilA
LRGRRLRAADRADFRKIRLARLTVPSVFCGNLPGNPSGGENCMSALMRFWRDEAATTAIEYGLIAFGISVVIVAAVNSIGTSVNGLFTNVSTGLSNVGK